MLDVVAYFETLSPFCQQLIGSAVFGIAVLVLRAVLAGMKRSGRHAFRVVTREMVRKQFIYANYIHSKEIAVSSYARVVIVEMAVGWAIRGAQVLVFVLAVEALLNGSWLLLVGYYLTFNCLFEALSWLKDWSKDPSLKSIDPKLRDELLAEILPQATTAQSDTPAAATANNTLERDASEATRASS